MGKPRVASQSGVLQGANPTVYNPSNPIILFIIQAGIIIIFCRLLYLPLNRIRQPKVIAEVIGGILLGPSVFGHIPGFTDAIFPTESIPILNMAANLGLIFYLFLIGLETDLRVMLKNWRIALSVGAAGMALPFGLGCAIAYGLYHHFRDDAGIKPVAFGTYVLFVGVATAITAFPVLCRILTELKLLQTQVGVIVLTAGVSNDVIGWILLALSVALVNSGSGIVALYVLLTCVAWVLFLVFAVRPVFMWILRRNGSIQNGPSQGIVGLTLLLTVTSAFFTGIIGVHPIFGAFLMGLVCPHEAGFAIKLAEKIEDLITVFFLPLYFALSGLSTNLGLLNNGTVWGYVVGIIAVAFVGKFVGGTIAARANKMVWRESFTIGVLMSCKGLVELIVLNIGLQAKILSQRTFTMFVVMALVTTFATTPLTTALFPPWYQKKLAAWKRGEIEWDGTRLMPEDASSGGDGSIAEKDQGSDIRRMLVSLRLDSLPSLFTFVALLGGERSNTRPVKSHPTMDRKAYDASETGQGNSVTAQRPLEVHGMRMLELSDRLSSVMKDSEADELSSRDPVVNAFQTFGQLNNVAVSAEVQLVPEVSFGSILADGASEHKSDMILLPWSETGDLAEMAQTDTTRNTFDNPLYNQYMAQFLDSTPCAAAVLVNNSFGGLSKEDKPLLPRVTTNLSLRSNIRVSPIAPLADLSHHIFFPFIGGPDDRVALRFVLRLAKNPNVTATIVHLRGNRANGAEEIHATTKDASAFITSTGSDTTDEHDRAFFSLMADSLASDMQNRVLFESMNTDDPVQESVVRAQAETGLSSKNAGDLVVVGRNSHPSGLGNRSSLETGLRDVLGIYAEALIKASVKASVLVIQSKKDM